MIYHELGRPGPPANDRDLFESDDDFITITERQDYKPRRLNEPGKKAVTLQSWEHRVICAKDKRVAYPEMWLNIYVSGPPLDAVGFPEMFARAKCWGVKDVDKADIVVFTGGADVDPALYGETRHSSVAIDVARDAADMDLYLKCLDEGIPMFGVCRGAQFLHVMNGGKLYQDVDGHYGDHKIHDMVNKGIIEPVSSVHHQQCIANYTGGMKMLAASHLSKKRWRNANTYDEGNKVEVEAFFYRETLCLGVQGHPEYRGYEDYTKWCLDMIYQFIVTCPDAQYYKTEGPEGTTTPNVLRIKPEIIEERQRKLMETLDNKQEIV